MARLRSIKPEFWTSEQIAECSPIARLLFIGIWNFCDDKGIHPCSAKRLKMEVFPADEFTHEQVAEWVLELIDAGLLKAYLHEGEGFLKVTGWAKHQKIDHPNKGGHPLPSGAFVEDSANVLGMLMERSRRSRVDQSGVEWSRAESKESTGPTRERRQGDRIRVAKTDRYRGLRDKIAKSVQVSDRDRTVLEMLAGLVSEGHLAEAVPMLALDDIAGRTLKNPMAYYWKCVKQRAGPVDVNALMSRVVPPDGTDAEDVEPLLTELANALALEVPQ